MRHYRKHNILILTILYLLAASACKKTETEIGPPLPPSISIDMDGLTTFSSKKKSAQLSDDSTNFKKAWKFVHTWDSICQKLMWVPKTIFLEALKDKTPIYNSTDSVWTWTYIKSVSGDGDYQAMLAAKPDDDSISWTLTVSRINGDGMYNFNWMIGRTDSKQSGGWWKLYDPISQKAFMLVNWAKENDNTRWIKYTNILECDCGNGSYIKYGTSTNVDFNASFNVLLVESNVSCKIDWNTSTYAGRIIYNGWIYGWDTTLKSLTPVQSN